MSDLISRQTLIEHLRRTIEASSNDGDYNEGFNDGMGFAACFASTLPSAQPERKKGRWTNAYDGYYGHVKCTGCFKTYDWTSQAQYYNYCPNCGARMEAPE